MVEPFAQRLDEANLRLQNAVEKTMMKNSSRLETQHHKLEALSPDNVLKRGYAVIRKKTNHSVVKVASELVAGDKVDIAWADGSHDAVIE